MASGDLLTTTGFHVVRHHDVWRIRMNGKHHGEYRLRVSAMSAATTETQAAAPGAKVFSTERKPIQIRMTAGRWPQLTLALTTTARSYGRRE